MSDDDIEAAFAAFDARTMWRINARNAARTLFDLVKEAEATADLNDGQLAETALIRASIARAVEAASYKASGLQRLSDWYSGAGIETAWTELHRAGERLLLVRGAVATHGCVRTVDAKLRNNLKPDDPRLTPAIGRLELLASIDSSALDAVARQELRDFEQIGNEAGDEAHANVRSLRNLLILIGGFATLATAAFAIVHALAPAFLSLAGAKGSDAVEVWEVELVGVLGGTIAAVFTIAKLGGFSGPYRLPVYQALIRVPAGAIVALAAVLLMQSKQIGALAPQSGLSVLAVALVFGYAPDVFLRFMDQKATSLLGEAQSKNDPTRPPLTQPVAPPATPASPKAQGPPAAQAALAVPGAEAAPAVPGAEATQVPEPAAAEEEAAR